MAKENKDLVVAPNGLTQLEATENLVQLAKEDIIVTTIGSIEELETIKEQYNGIVLANLDDMSAYTTVEQGIKTLKKFSKELEEARVARTAPAVKYQKDLKAAVDEIKAGIDPVIKHLTDQKTKFDDAVKAKLDEQFTKRTQELMKRHYQLVGGFYVCGVIQVDAGQLRTMTDEQFQFYITEGDKEVERIKAQKEREEAEAKRKKEEEERLQAEAQRLREEREKFERERAEFEAWKASQSAEIEAQKAGLEQAYDIVEQAPQEVSVVEASKEDEDALAKMAQFEVADEEPVVSNIPPVSPEELKQERYPAVSIPVPKREEPKPIAAKISTQSIPKSDSLIGMEKYNEGFKAGMKEFHKRLTAFLDDPNQKKSIALIREFALNQIK